MTVRRVGIVVAAFNATNYIEKTLASIREQSHTDWSCVIVDDGSTDDTAAVVARVAADEPRFRLVSTPNQGICRARNVGIAALGSTVTDITCMDADDVWLPTALEKMVEALGRRPDCIGVHALGEFIGADGSPLSPGEFAAYGRHRRSGRSGRMKDCPLDADTTFETICTSSTVFPPGLVLMRRGIYADIGGYDPAAVEADWDLLVRATRHGPLAFVDSIVILYRRHEANVGAQAQIRLYTHITRLRAFASLENSDEHRKTLRACWRAQQWEAMLVQLSAMRDAKALRGWFEAAARAWLAAWRYARGKPRLRFRDRAYKPQVKQRAPGPTSTFR